MTSRDAFFQLQEHVYFVDHEQRTSLPSVRANSRGSKVFIGCKLKNCPDCILHKQLARDRDDCRFLSFRSSVTKLTYGPQNQLTISNDADASSIDESNQLNPDICKRDLCDACKGIDWRGLCAGEMKAVLFHSFPQLFASSGSCALCALFVHILPDEFSFRADDRRPITLRSAARGHSVYVSFPSLEEDNEEWEAVRESKLYIYSTSNNATSVSGKKLSELSGPVSQEEAKRPHQLPQCAQDPTVAKQWLFECVEHHEKCRAYTKSNQDAQRPFRLVDVGVGEGPIYARLEERPVQEDYLTLSYCWGDKSTITMTTTETLATFKQHLPFSSLSRIFQDALTVTRSLGLRYVWIDALCIIQDSKEDKEKELAHMADIYAASLLTLSASRATSGESSLFEPHQIYNAVPLPRSMNEDGHHFCITNQVFHNFSSDVPRGSLGSRGWCFQERLLGPRILHFGQQQRHWECHEGIWSEDKPQRQWYDTTSTIDDGRFRETLLAISQAPFSDEWRILGSRLEGEDLTTEMEEAWQSMPANFPIWRQEQEERLSRDAVGTVRRNEFYDKWYKSVSAYTARKLTYSSDRLLALAGVASKFNSCLKDQYAAGMWVGDLVHGILWSRRRFAKVQVDEKVARRPGLGGRCESSTTPPSWSWASVDGAVHWVQKPREEQIYVEACAVMTTDDMTGFYGQPEWAALRLKCALLELEDVTHLRHEIDDCDEYRSDRENWILTLSERHRPQADFDDPGLEFLLRQRGRTGPLYFVLVAAVPLQDTRLPGNEDEEVSPEPIALGYALMLRYYPDEAAHRRVGLAKVALRDFVGIESDDVNIL